MTVQEATEQFNVAEFKVRAAQKERDSAFAALVEAKAEDKGILIGDIVKEGNRRCVVISFGGSWGVRISPLLKDGNPSKAVVWERAIEWLEKVQP